MASQPYYAAPYSLCFLSPRAQQDLERDEQIYSSYEKLTSQLPISHGWSPFSLQHYQSFWIPSRLVTACMAIQSHFNPRPSDIILVTSPKSGTTWLKALSFATLHRRSFSLSSHPLLTNTPHQCVPLLERFYSHRTIPNLNVLPSPTIFATHLPFSLLPQSALGCRIVYLCRDPKDAFVSLYHFLDRCIGSSAEHKSTTQGLDLSKVFQMFSRGTSAFAPFWDHVLGYWKESLKSPEMVLFFRYEEMMEDPASHLRRLAEFMGCPFSMEEERDTTRKQAHQQNPFVKSCLKPYTNPKNSIERIILKFHLKENRQPRVVGRVLGAFGLLITDSCGLLRVWSDGCGLPKAWSEFDGVVEDIVKLCSFDNLREVEVNKDNKGNFEERRPPPSSFFRKGKVGDWVNYLSMEMAEKLDAITKEKLHGSGLSFESSSVVP
ncbi:P-loop containing nucleoside triphosphate hydrolase protein [Dioscorea alata]|uniref:P-loop containing nucleoside triphosphate hydrolase protein n=1 Tax=Dioscorea alata TaxID=55571 RepID=A0ACB7V0L7_DIOAL|nr:P-loop containing nucleoside triphosphate hydrolase protein [Dioscorea alata]